MQRVRKQLSYANVMATLAVVIAVAGGTTAIAASVGKNSVSAKSIKNGNVTAPKLAGIRVVINGFVSDGSGADAKASCSSKERLIGGGAKGTPFVGPTNFVDLQSSYPEGNSWLVELAGNGGSGTILAYALCLKAKP